jgi:hypothetical protein
MQEVNINCQVQRDNLAQFWQSRQHLEAMSGSKNRLKWLVLFLQYSGAFV